MLGSDERWSRRGLRRRPPRIQAPSHLASGFFGALFQWTFKPLCRLRMAAWWGHQDCPRQVEIGRHEAGNGRCDGLAGQELVGELEHRQHDGEDEQQHVEGDRLVLWVVIAVTYSPQTAEDAEVFGQDRRDIVT